MEHQEKTQGEAINSLHNFDLSTFKKSSESMIATNDNAYNQSHFKWDRVKPVRDYSAEEIQSILTSGSVEAQRQLSNNYVAANGFYKEIIMHYATLLKYCGILIPNPALGKSLQDQPIAKRYHSAMNFMDKACLESVGPYIAYRVLRDGTYYCAVQTLTKDAVALLDLPFEYCRTRFKNQFGVNIVEFNVSYFDERISSEKDRDAALNTYPKVISSYYRKWSRHKSKLNNWLFLPSEIGVAFNLFDARPYFLSVIPETIKYDQAVENELAREIEEIKKLIVQKIPHLNDGTLLFEPNEAQVMHDGTVKMLRSSNPNVSVITTYGDVDVPSVKTSDAATSNALKNMMQSMYASAGVSSEIFAASGSSSLKTSIANDISVMMVLANKIGNFFTSLLNQVCANGSIQFKYTILPVSYHNDRDYADSYFKYAGSGYPFSLPAIALGLNQRDLSNIKVLENEVLKLSEVLLPLSSAYTQSGDGGSGNDGSSDSDGGRPEKDDLDKTDKTNKNKESKDKTGG